MPRPVEVMIKPWNGTPFALKVGDTVLQQINQRWPSDGPPTVAAYTVAALCGGSVRQWVRLSNGQEFDLAGNAKGDKSYGCILTYDAEYLTKAQAERATFENLRKLRHRVEGLNWRQVIDKTGVAEKLKDLLDAIEGK